jgi:hypothetical protein
MPGIITPSVLVAGSILLDLGVSEESVEAIESGLSFLQCSERECKPVIFSYQHRVCKRRLPERRKNKAEVRGRALGLHLSAEELSRHSRLFW